MTRVFLNRIGTAVPAHDIHEEFVQFALSVAPDERSEALFTRMAEMADIDHRYALFGSAGAPWPVHIDGAGLYRRGAFPSTAARMALYPEAARALALQAIEPMALDRGAVTHLIVASCTGFSAPGLDFHLMQALGLRDSVERTIVGFMGCFAAVNALKLARHIVRSEPAARVLVVNLELCCLHMQEEWRLETMLMFLLFGDGCGVSLVSAEPEGLELGAFRAAVIPDSADLITWHIGDQGFDMRLSGKVPGVIRRWMAGDGAAFLDPAETARIRHWAVHAGGRSILDAVQQAMKLPPAALGHSRQVLRAYGNMSSATLVFVLDRILREREGMGGAGLAMAFGPGLTVESFRFEKCS